jgi:phasin family protein
MRPGSGLEEDQTMATKTGNPFLDQDFSDMFDMKKVMQAFQMPSMDSNMLVEAQRKNFEAMANANRVAFEGAQAVVKRQGEIVRQSMQDASEAMKAMNGADSAEDRVAKQTEAAKKAFQNALTNMHELADMAQKSNTEALSYINKRVTESFDEMRDGMQQMAKQADQAASVNGGATQSAGAKKQ